MSCHAQDGPDRVKDGAIPDTNIWEVLGGEKQLSARSAEVLWFELALSSREACGQVARLRMGFRLLFLLGGNAHSDCSIKYVVSECPNYGVPGSCLAHMTVFLKIAGDLNGRFRQIHRWYSNKLKRTDRDSWGICLNSLSQHQGTSWCFLFACSLMPGPLPETRFFRSTEPGPKFGLFFGSYTIPACLLLAIFPNSTLLRCQAQLYFSKGTLTGPWINHSLL